MISQLIALFRHHVIRPATLGYSRCPHLPASFPRVFKSLGVLSLSRSPLALSANIKFLPKETLSSLSLSSLWALVDPPPDSEAVEVVCTASPPPVPPSSWADLRDTEGPVHLDHRWTDHGVLSDNTSLTYVYGPSESGKSSWAREAARALQREGHYAVYASLCELGLANVNQHLLLQVLPHSAERQYEDTVFSAMFKAVTDSGRRVFIFVDDAHRLKRTDAVITTLLDWHLRFGVTVVFVAGNNNCNPDLRYTRGVNQHIRVLPITPFSSHKATSVVEKLCVDPQRTVLLRNTVGTSVGKLASVVARYNRLYKGLLDGEGQPPSEDRSNALWDQAVAEEVGAALEILQWALTMPSVTHVNDAKHLLSIMPHDSSLCVQATHALAVATQLVKRGVLTTHKPHHYGWKHQVLATAYEQHKHTFVPLNIVPLPSKNLKNMFKKK